jgi:hypothetical protein
VVRTAAMLIGYARACTADQNTGLALRERGLKGAGCAGYSASRLSAWRGDRLKALREFALKGDAIVATKPAPWRAAPLSCSRSRLTCQSVASA